MLFSCRNRVVLDQDTEIPCKIGYFPQGWRRRLIEETLEDPPGDPHGALIWIEDDAELDGIAVGIPTSHPLGR